MEQKEYKECIEREKIGLTDFEIVMCNGDYKDALKMLLEKIENILAADVRPVVRGNWVAADFHTVKCTICGFEMDIMKVDDHILNHANFCPNCGADMRGNRDGDLYSRYGDAENL